MRANAAANSRTKNKDTIISRCALRRIIAFVKVLIVNITRITAINAEAIMPVNETTMASTVREQNVTVQDLISSKVQVPAMLCQI
mmetsp:Transcript_40621/g.46185  ORF Transcript_40621/g.46185 Transcript_40621/m.46185 type:complete len:85 (-) Transcript_40621:2122-2376(-)